jgi:hypothetical protein
MVLTDKERDVSGGNKMFLFKVRGVRFDEKSNSEEAFGEFWETALTGEEKTHSFSNVKQCFDGEYKRPKVLIASMPKIAGVLFSVT